MTHILCLMIAIICVSASPAIAQHRPLIALGAAIAGAGTVLATTAQASTEVPTDNWRMNPTTRRLERITVNVPYTNSSRLVSGLVLMAGGTTLAVIGVRHRATVAVSPSRIQVLYRW